MKKVTALAFLTVGIIGLLLVSGCVEKPAGGEECAEEGEHFSTLYEEYPQRCCKGLTEWESGFDTRISIADVCYETGLLAGSRVGTCINCGNGICENIEDPCNCPEDCIGKNKSDFLTVEDFCQDIDWSQALATACEETIRDFPICGLC